MTEHEHHDPADAATAAELSSAFAAVTFDRSVAEITAKETPAHELSGRRRRRSAWVVGGAAAAVAAVTVGIVLLPGGSSTAWAATPTPVSGSDEQLATKACAAILPSLYLPPQGPGGGESGTTVSGDGSGAGGMVTSGTAVAGSAPGAGATPDVVRGQGSRTVVGGGASAPSSGSQHPSALPAPPTTLPPLVAVDRRGDRAVAVFEDSASSVACLLSIDGSTWNAGGLMVGILDKGSAQPVAQLGMMTAAAGGAPAAEAPSNVVAGTVGPEVERVTLTFADGTVAEATVTHGVYAAWFPGDFGTTPPTVTMYDAQGHAL